MDNTVINEDGNKDDIFTKHGRNVFSPKILDRSSRTHIMKNTGYQLGGFVEDKG